MSSLHPNLVNERDIRTEVARVDALPNMPLSDLKALWRDVYEDEPPSGHKSHIVRRLAYRLQELAYGVDP